MATFFISHSIHDHEKVEWLLRRLRSWGYESLYLHSHPEDGIAVGEQWERGLYRQMHLADAVLYVESRASAESRWCFAELALARSANKPIFPVAIERGARMPLLEDRQSLDLTDGEAAVERLRRALRERFDPREIFSWDLRRAPYPGLTAFEAADAAIFFGRDDAVAELLGHLDATLGRGRCVSVIGASGSGKSSLVRAGLLPRLGRVRDRWVVVPPVTPGERPVGALARALAAALGASGRPADSRDLQHRIESDRAQFVEMLRDLATADDGRQRSVLLVVDQAEELVVLADPRERARFVQLLRDGLAADSRLWVVATLRSEFLSASLRDEALVALIEESVLLGPLGRSRLAEVIVGPAAKAGLRFAPGLVERMVEDARGGDALPLLAYTLRELYDRERPDPNVASHEDYNAIGGVLGALRRRADLVAEQLTRSGHGERVLPTLLRLVTVDTEGEPSRRRLPRSELNAAEREVVHAFVNARLLVSYQRGGQAVIDVAHEALLRSWGPLSDAIVAAQDRLRLRSQLEREAGEWLRVGCLDSYLLRGERLMRARRALNAPAAGAAAPLEAAIEEFYRSSEELETRERAVVARRRRRVVLGLSLGLTVVSIAALGFFWQYQRARDQTRVAERESRIADARRVAALALADDADPDQSALLALEAYRLSDIPEARDALLKQMPRIAQADAVARATSVPLGVSAVGEGRNFATLTANGTLTTWEARARDPRRVRLRGQPLPVASAAFSPRAGLVATAAADHIVRLWDLRTGREVGPALRGHTGTILGLAFDPDGHLLASASADRTVRLWDVRRHRQIGAPLAGHTGRVHAVAFSPAGDTVASGGFDRTVRLWDVQTHQETGRSLRGHAGVVLTVAFTPDGKWVASGGADRTVRLWNTRTHRQVGSPLRGQADSVLSVIFSPDGRFLASGGEDRAVRLWDPATHTQISSPFRGHTDRVVGVAFSHDGRTLVSASADRTLRTWDRNVELPIRGHEGTVFSAAFLGATPLVATAADSTIRVWNANSRALAWSVRADRTGLVLSIASTRTGDLLASGGVDGRVHLWDMAHRVEVRPSLRGHQTPVESVAMSPDGRTVASAGDDRTIRLWDVRTHRQIGSPLSGHTDVITSVAFNGTGRTLVSGSVDRTVRLWDVRSRRELGLPMRGHSGPVSSVAFSDDGKTTASASTDKTIRLWNAATRRPVGRPLHGHSEAVLSVAFAPGGRLLASGAADDSVRLWDARSHQPLAPPLRGHTDDVLAVRFSRDGRRLASGGADRTARLWDALRWTADWSVLRRAVCARLARNLTYDEWKEAFPGRAYRTTCPTGHR